MLIESRPVSQLERILHLKRSTTLAQMPAADLAIIADNTRERFFRRGEWLLREAEPIPAVYVVVEGTLHVRRNGRELGHACAGAAVGGLGIVAGETGGIEARAETDVLALELPADVLLDILEDHFSIYRHVLQLTCRSIVELWSRVTLPEAPCIGDVGHAAGAGLDFVERIMLLRQSGVFAQASLNALAELSRGLVELAFEPGTALWRAGDAARGLILVVRGEVECVTRSSGSSLLARPGAAVGAAEAIAGLPRFYDAVAKERVVCLYGDVEAMLDVFEDNFDMAASYLTVVSRWLLDLIERASEQEVGLLGSFYGCALEPEEP